MDPIKGTEYKFASERLGASTMLVAGPSIYRGRVQRAFSVNFRGRSMHTSILDSNGSSQACFTASIPDYTDSSIFFQEN